MTTSRPFPPDFTWGVATSSYQIEGGVHEDGRGESIWDRFCRTPGKVKAGDHGDVACDHYHRWRDDIALMKKMGVRAYRFSIAWSRIFPTGQESEPNPAGLDFYSSLVDALLEAGITPWVTLYHWDLPQALEDRGGWPDRQIVASFVRFADVVARRLGDRVKHWITHNEPWVVCHLGHAVGEHAPGRKSWPDALAASHHILLSHGAAVPVIRSHCPDGQVGITLNLCPAEPASPSEADADATRHFDGFFNRWYLDPLFGRGYPADLVADYQAKGHLGADPLPWVQEGDLDTIAVPTDFLGINYYSRAVVRSDEIPESENIPREVFDAPAEERTDFNWEVHPESLVRLLRRVHADYAPAQIAITENGCSYATAPDSEGRIRDVRRRRFFHDHLVACHEAIEAGVPLSAYFGWSLMDNFEWAEGYGQRFGLTWVDYDTQQRIPKDSFHWYSRSIRAGGPAPLPLPTADERDGE
jgi:beta-glucosidase